MGQLTSANRTVRLVAMLGVASLCIFASAVAPALRWADVHLWDEAVRDHWVALRYDEDWASAKPLPRVLDYSWLDRSARPIMIAHALGESDSPGQNTLPALQRSLAEGLRLLEIDIWLDKSSQLRCHHGPSAPPPLTPGGCTLTQALHDAAAAGAWLILDIKTDFAVTAARIEAQFGSDPTATRLIFQLYHPSDIDVFASLSTRMPLPGPVVTAYAARRSLQHIAHHTARVGVRAYAVPISRSMAISTHPKGLVLLVHPVHDCAAAEEANAKLAEGYYLTRDLAVRLRQGCRI